MPTKFGVQPARQVLFDERWSVSKAAARIGVSEQHLARAAHGRILPSDTVLDRLPDFLGVELTDLFTPDVLQRVARRRRLEQLAQ